MDHLAIDCEFSWCYFVITAASVPSCHNSSITKFNATATKWMFRIHCLVLLQVLLTPLTRSMFLILFTSNNHSLHYQLKLQTSFRLLRLRFQLHLLLIPCLPTVTVFSVRLFWLNPQPTFLQFVTVSVVQQDESNWIFYSGVTPCFGLLMFQLCSVPGAGLGLLGGCRSVAPPPC